MQLSDVDGLIRQPWVGDGYKKKKLGIRLLVVGESHYHKHDRECSDDELHANITRDIIKNVIEGKLRYAFFTKTAALFRQEALSFLAMWPFITSPSSYLNDLGRK